MEPAHLLAFNLALLAAWLVPGPAMLVALRAALSEGRGAGIATGLGLAVMASVWTLLALAGLDGLLRLFPWAAGALRILGAAYLIWIAWRTWRGAADPVGAAGPHGRGGWRRAVLDGLLVNLGNPKSVLFAAAVLVVIFPPDMGWSGKALVVLNHLVLEIALYALLAALVAAPPVARRYLAARAWIDRAAAAVLGALGLRLLLDRL